MSADTDADLVVDGTAVRFVPSHDDRSRVLADDADIGSIEAAPDGPGYVARGADGDALTRASQWGGSVSARFGSKELAVRALLSLR